MTTLPSSSSRSVAHARVCAVDPDALARWADAIGPAVPEADRLTVAVASLAGALVAAIPPTATRPGGGRAAVVARGLAERWARDAGVWAVEVDAHLAAVEATGRAHAEADRAGARAWRGVGR